MQPFTVKWTKTFIVGPVWPSIEETDKIILPPTILESLIHAKSYQDPQTPSVDHQTRDIHQSRSNEALSRPFTFQLVNHSTRCVTYVGVQEFVAADDSTVHIPSWKCKLLDCTEGDQITVKMVDLPRGTWVRFRAMMSDVSYQEIPDYRAAFESYLRSKFTTLTTGEIFDLHQGTRTYPFLVEALKPAEAVSIIDTDLEVEIASDIDDFPNEKAGREKSKTSFSPQNESHILKLGQSITGKVKQGEYAYFKVFYSSEEDNIQLVHNKEITDTLVTLQVLDNGDADLFVSNLTTRPEDSYNELCDISNQREKSVLVPEILIRDQDLFISIKGYESANNDGLIEYCVGCKKNEAISVPGNLAVSTRQSHEFEDGYIQCSNCKTWIPDRSANIHLSFCERNNILCPSGCGKIFQKGSLDYNKHWHCEKCAKFGDEKEKPKHYHYFHEPISCTCNYQAPSIIQLSEHKHSVYCPNRLITCRFCANMVKAGYMSGSAEDLLLGGMTEHESYCGNRTTLCNKCSKPVALKNMGVHETLHKSAQQRQPLPFRLCHNENCTRAIDPKYTTTNNDRFVKTEIVTHNLCSSCFGPLYSPTRDSDGTKLIQRIAKKYHQQLVVGCGNKQCINRFCSSGSGKVYDPTEAATILLPILKDGLERNPKFYFCTGETINKRRRLANVLSGQSELSADLNGSSSAQTTETESIYAIEWCVLALEKNEDDVLRAMSWLEENAPKL